MKKRERERKRGGAKSWGCEKTIMGKREKRRGWKGQIGRVRVENDEFLNSLPATLIREVEEKD